MAIPDGENVLRICLLVSTEYTNVTDGQTDRQTPRDGIGALMHSIARQKLLVRATIIMIIINFHDALSCVIISAAFTSIVIR